jgi:hypothetical protein
MLIYRVAHRTAIYNGFPSGPYSGSGLPWETRSALRDMGREHSRDLRHPSPRQDSKLKHIFGVERCGFTSRRELYEWFEGFVQLLRDWEFVVYSYDVPDRYVRVGKFGQVIFDKNHANEVSAEELNFDLPMD